MRVVRSKKQGAHAPRSPHGTVLIIVLVVVVLLALGAYTFSEFMVLEARSSHMHGQAVRARALADSGVEMVAAQLQDGLAADPLAIYDNPELYRAATIQQGDGTSGRFSIIAPINGDDSGTAVRYGLIDESGKLNINTILTLRGVRDDEEKARLIFSYLPYGSPELADAILDFIDEDDEPREFGAESEMYESYGYSAKNGPLDTLDELLLVQGITPELLFGEDANRNGLLDPNENDGEATLPFDNGDGRLDRGWSAYLTVWGRERNLQADGADRIFANNGVLTDLYDELVEAFDEDVATFVVAYRIHGPYDPENPNGTGNTNPDGTPILNQMNQNMQNGQSQEQAGQQAALSLGRALAGSDGTSGTITRGGMDLSKGGTKTLTSLYDLVGVQVQANINGAQTLLDSPWPNDAAAMPAYLPEMMDKLTLTEASSIEARVNVNQASFEVLAGILAASGLEARGEEIAMAIVEAQQVATGGMSISDTLSNRATTGWLVAEGLVEMEEMRLIDPYLTAGGAVYRFQCVGFFDQGGPTSRVEAVIDASGDTPQIIFLRDLTDLGRGFPMSVLGN